LFILPIQLKPQAATKTKNRKKQKFELMLTRRAKA